MFAYHKVSSGEHLSALLFDNAVNEGFWCRFQDKHLIATGRARDFRFFFQEAIALNLTRRLILAAEAAKESLDPSESGFLSLLSPSVERWGLRNLDHRGQLARLVTASVVAANHRISDTLRRRCLSWAEKHHRGCYMCGEMLNFNLGSGVPTHSDITLDHLWPQAYGGDSIEENILPACRSCNSEKKQDYPSWAGCNVHTLNIPAQPSEEALKQVGKHFRFALYNRAAKSLANRNQLTLRQAYIKLGKWTNTPWLIDEDEIGDFFNIANYDPTRTDYGNLLLQQHPS
jgi:5-methylcytosine-specific restriction endonuclease McrA